jgi:outer membrane protein OmpA-like peptidoglycan-associated protein
MQTEPVEEKKTSDDMISDNTKDPDVMQDGERLSLQPERKQVEDKIDMEPGDGVVDRADDDITPPAEEIQEPPPTTTEMAPQKDDQAETKSTRVITPGKIMHLFYQGSATDLSQAAKSKLGPIVDYLTTNDAARLQIRAFASQRGGQSASDARRLSLSRALALRSHLMENGISSLRLDVRALGSGDALSDDVPSDLPKDRIDLRIID